MSNVLAISDTIQIVVQHFPNAGVITGPDTVCVGSYITLTDSISGGVWSVNNNELSIDSRIAYAVSVPKGTTFDTCTVFYTITNACGHSADSIKITLIDLYDPRWELSMIPGGPLCAGTTITEDYDSSYFGYYLQYMHSTYGLIGFSDDQYNMEFNIYVNRAGTEYVYVYDSNYCGVISVGKYVSIEKTLGGKIILPKNGVCLGDTLQLTDSGFLGMLSWYFSDNFLLALNESGLVKAVASGTTTINASVSMACGGANTWSSLLIHDTPKVSIFTDTLCIGETATASADSDGGHWSTINSDILNIEAENGTITAIAAGTAMIRYTAPTGCAADTTIQVENCPSLILIYPNPTTESIEVHLLSDAFNNFMVMNDVGQSLITGIIADRYSFINTESLSPGIYFLKVAGPGQSQVLRFVKE